MSYKQQQSLHMEVIGVDGWVEYTETFTQELTYFNLCNILNLFHVHYISQGTHMNKVKYIT